MSLPHPERAVVDERTLQDYCLSPNHPRGRHKALVFAAALGLTAQDAEKLRVALISAAHTGLAIATDADEYGQKYLIDFKMTTEAGSATVRSGWIVRSAEDCPRFITCWVL